MLKRVLKKITDIKIVPTKQLPLITIGEGNADACKIYMDIFKQGNTNPYIIYSAGIGDKINFELDILNKLQEKGIGVELYAIDPTPKALQYLERQNLPANFHVVPYAVADKNGDLFFALPQTEGWVSGSAADVENDNRNLDLKNKIKVNGRTISSIMKEFGHNKIDLLKMDIEGSEFDVLRETLSKSIDINEMCIDHHEHMLKNGNKHIKSLLSLINKSYDIFYAENSDNHARYFCCIHK